MLPEDDDLVTRVLLVMSVIVISFTLYIILASRKPTLPFMTRHIDVSHSIEVDP